MPTSRLMKALLVAIPSGLWLALQHATLAQTLALAAGAALVTWAWIELAALPQVAPLPRPAVAPARPAAPAAHRCRRDCRIPRTPSGRSARDLRCPAFRATAPARRSTRR